VTIEQLRALERAATADGWKVERSDGDLEVGCPDRFDVVTLTGAPICTMMCGTYSECEANGDIISAARNALPALLKVAEAAYLVKAANARRANAQVQDCCERIDYEKSMGHACDQLTRAIEELEAQ